MADQVNIAGATSGNSVKLDNVVLDVYTKDILFSAQPVLRFEGICKINTDLTAIPGNTIKFLRYAPLTGKSDIAETATVEAQSMSTSLVSITVTEHVKAIQVSEMLLRSSSVQTLENGATLLGQHYAKDRDRLLRDTLLTTTNVLYPNARVSRAGITASDFFNVNLIRDAAELLATNKAPKINGDAYICFVNPHQGRYLRADSAWINASNYGAPNQLFTGEIGRIEDVRFIETTHITYIKKTTQDIWADSVDTLDNTAIAANAVADVHQAIIVGDYAIGLAEALPVQMRDNGVLDYGRKHALAYYGIWGAGLIETGHLAVLETA